jgi:hypothetical protein
MTLHSIRQRALSEDLRCSARVSRLALTTLDVILTACRTCVWTLHDELCHLLELQHAFRQLAYTDVRTRSRLTIQIVRITINLPLKIQEALTTDYPQRQGRHSRERGEGQEEYSRTPLIPHRICLVIRGIVVILERMEDGLK